MSENKNWIVYDIEIEKGIPFGNLEPDILYCDGWHDYTNMGISVIGVYDYFHDRYRVICKDNIKEIELLIRRADRVISFNGDAFNSQVLLATWGIGIFPNTSYDLLCEVWKAAGLGRAFNYRTHSGYSLDALCAANGLQPKTGKGALAPVEWQHGNVGTVIDYCLQDVRLTKQLMDLVQTNQQLRDPKTGAFLTMPE